MTNTSPKEIQVKEKQEVSSAAEQTMPGPVFTPDVDIFETENEITLLADMPGVKADALTIDLKENVLTLSGDVTPFEASDENTILAEYETGKYYRQFTLSEIVDQNNINAGLKDGVLRLTLPKVKKAVPRKIEVKTA
jgi:HSP20 family molecular chaperone IbpA